LNGEEAQGIKIYFIIMANMEKNGNIQDAQPKSGKWRKRVKWILMGL
jgi:hypothetical protein